MERSHQRHHQPDGTFSALCGSPGGFAVWCAWLPVPFLVAVLALFMARRGGYYCSAGRYVFVFRAQRVA